MEVSERFHKAHKTVIRNIETLAQNCADVKNMFCKTTYKDSYEREQPKYLINRDGFSLLAMGFTGKEALEWKIKYIYAFNEMEQIIKERSTNEWIATRYQGKLTRKTETDTIQKLVDYASGQGSEHTDMLYMTYSKLANSVAGISKRDNATISQLNNLELIENIILHVIDTGIMLDKHYKVINR